MRSPREFKGIALAGIENRRNPSYLRSIWLGLQRGVFYAPDAFLRFFTEPLKVCIQSVLMAAFCLMFVAIGSVVFVFAQACIVLIGLTGRLTKISHAGNSQSVVS